MSTAQVTVPESAPQRVPRFRIGKIRVSAAVSVAWLVVIVAAVLLAPVIAPAGPNAQDLAQTLQGPSAAHLFGTDSLGRDLLARILYGGLPTFLGIVIAILVAVGVGAPAGLAGGYLRGAVDRVLAVVADILMAVPLILVLLVAFAIFPSNIAVSMALFGLFTSSAIYRIVRGATLTVAGELYVTAARAAGLTDGQIIARHLAPRLAALLRVQVSVVAAIALVTEVGLGFLGLDVAPPAPSWGGLVADASQNLANDPFLLLPPTVVICLTILALGVLGDVAQPIRIRKSRAAAPPDEQAPTRAHPVVLRDDALLSVVDLTVTTLGRDAVTLVEHVSFDVRRGEVVGLVGESGAGKSVTARALTRLDKGTVVSGVVRFEDQDLTALPEAELGRIRGKRIAFIGQDPMSALDPLFRIQSQLVEALRTHRTITKVNARREAIELLRAVRINDPEAVGRKYPFEISGGMAQRVAIALALAGDPDLLIADEPTTALDVTVQMEVLGLLQQLQRERRLAIILVTHDWGVVADICDRAVTLYAGEIVESGDVEAVFALPSHPYTASLRRSDPHLQEVGAMLKSIPGTVPAPSARPGHCRFADRCPVVEERCRTIHPDLVVLPGNARESRCIRTEELREGLIHV